MSAMKDLTHTATQLLSTVLNGLVSNVEVKQPLGETVNDIISQQINSNGSI